MISHYSPDDGKFTSSSGIEYDVQIYDNSHLMLLVILGKLKEGASLQETYTQLMVNYDFKYKY